MFRVKKLVFLLSCSKSQFGKLVKCNSRSGCRCRSGGQTARITPGEKRCPSDLTDEERERMAVYASHRASRPPMGDRILQGDQRGKLFCWFRLRLTDAADQLGYWRDSFCSRPSMTLN